MNDNIFLQCIETHIKFKRVAANSKRKPDSTFFNEWFRKKGYCYTFVFKKNLAVTNIQYAELLTLVRKFTRENGLPSPTFEVQFLTVNDFVEKIDLLCRTFGFYDQKDLSERRLKEMIRHFTQLYAKIFRSIIVIDTFFGSANVYIPYNQSLNIQDIAFYSGYIHSCGFNIYTRKIYKSDDKDFQANIESHLLKTKSTNKPEKEIPFIPYCHEDFSPYDHLEDQHVLNSGLNDLKFYIEKTFMGNKPLSEVLNTIKLKFKKTLSVPSPGDYHRSITANSENSIFLITDRSINPESLTRGKYKYFICYQQLLINENQFQIFDENKPGWIDHVTIPHSLLGAMLNLGIMNAKDKKIRITDPFVGSGTTPLELLKFDHIDFTGSDLNPMSNQVFQDNMFFFNKP